MSDKTTEALTEALYADGELGPGYMLREDCEHLARRVLASGVVVPAAEANELRRKASHASELAELLDESQCEVGRLQAVGAERESLRCDALDRAERAEAEASELRQAVEALAQEMSWAHTFEQWDDLCRRLRAVLAAAPGRCTTCGGAGLVDWRVESDPNCYQTPDDAGKVPCPDCSAAPERAEGAGGCVPCRACGGDQSRGWHKHDSTTGSES